MDRGSGDRGREDGGRTGLRPVPAALGDRAPHQGSRDAGLCVAISRERGRNPCSAGNPVSIRIEFVTSQMADMASLYPGSIRLDGRTIEFASQDMPSAYRGFRAAVTLASV